MLEGEKSITYIFFCIGNQEIILSRSFNKKVGTKQCRKQSALVACFAKNKQFVEVASYLLYSHIGLNKTR